MTADSIPAPLLAACPGVRLACPADGVAGAQPSYVASPASTRQASAVMRAAASLSLAVLPRGAGTRLDWGSPPSRCDLVIETTRMDQVLEHAAGDLVARVQAGASFDHLAKVLSAAGQQLAVDPPASAGTVGGILATGAAGPRRLRYGAPRDLLIGITVIRADGTVAKAGGKVVKNVAGYDIGKLFAGSHGTLGLITEAIFRLHPLPGASLFVTLECADAATAYSVMSAAVTSPLAPSAAEIDWPGAGTPIRAGILLEGDPEGTPERADRLRGLLGSTAVISDAPPPWWGLGAAAADDSTVVRIAFWAADFPRILAAVQAAAAAAGLEAAVNGSAAAGVIYASLPRAAGPDAVTQFLAAVRAAVGQGPAAAARDPRAPEPPPGGPATAPGGPSASGPAPGGAAAAARGPRAPHPAAAPMMRGSAVVLHAPAGVREVIDMWGPVPSLGLMRAVKDQFDPEHRMAPGRFAGGL